MTIPMEYAVSALVAALCIGFVAGVRVCSWINKRNAKVPA